MKPKQEHELPIPDADAVSRYVEAYTELMRMLAIENSHAAMLALAYCGGVTVGQMPDGVPDWYRKRFVAFLEAGLSGDWNGDKLVALCSPPSTDKAGN